MGDMIRAEKLVKIYDASRPDVRALDGVSFVLPARGMVFFVGKSGSGKSTLMNILGGLDSPTSGEVYIDGKPFSQMSAEEKDAFRGDNVGFVFQDFLLFDNMTSLANVAVSQDIAGDKDEGRAAAALAEMEMERFGERRPKHLSAGQKQRVAIARALVKHPKIVLADEPTGNIDAENTELVLDTLKRLSEEALVVVISHSESDALRYADRIIRLSEGRIVSDTVKNEGYTDTLDIADGCASLPARALTPDEVARLNAAIAEGGMTVVQKDGGFVPAGEQRDEPGISPRKRTRMRPAAFLRYSFMLLKKGGLGKAVMFVLMGLLLALFAVAQNFAAFDKTEMVSEYAAQTSENGIVMRMGRMDGPAGFETFKDDAYVNIDDEALSGLRGIYDEELFELYSVMTPMNDPVTKHYIESAMVQPAWEQFSRVYATETNGVLVCDIDYLKRLYGDENGELHFLVGGLGEDGAEVIVTDYVLDAYIYHGYIASAEALLGMDYSNQRVDIAGVIDTGYKERYSELAAMLARGEIPTKDTPLFAEFVYEVSNYLNLCYSVNPDWREDYLEDYAARVAIGFVHFDEVGFVAENGKSFGPVGQYLYYHDGIAEDEAWMNYEVYNALFGTSYTKENARVTDVSGDGHTIDVSLTARDGSKFTRTFRVTGLDMNSALGISKSYLKGDKATSVLTYAVYLTDAENAIGSIEAAEEMLFYPTGEEVRALLDVAEIAEIIAELLGYIAVAVAVLTVLMVALTAAITLRSGIFEIGMLRALGCTTARVGAMFLLQVAVMCITVCVIGAVGAALGTAFADGAVAANIEEAYPMVTLVDLHVASYDNALMAADCAVAAAVTAASGIIPVLAVRRVRPVRIIRAKE